MQEKFAVTPAAVYRSKFNNSVSLRTHSVRNKPHRKKLLFFFLSNSWSIRNLFKAQSANRQHFGWFLHQLNFMCPQTEIFSQNCSCSWAGKVQRVAYYNTSACLDNFQRLLLQPQYFLLIGLSSSILWCFVQSRQCTIKQWLKKNISLVRLNLP